MHSKEKFSFVYKKISLEYGQCMKHPNVRRVDFQDREVTDPHIDPEWTLLYYLREKLCLTGTKLGCGTGGCGTCTVMISCYNHKTENVIHQARRACLIRVAALHGYAVTTVEGIGGTFTKLHPVQKRIAEAHGSQCGFCTPGMVMSMYTLLRNTCTPTMLDIENALKGNLCRCTGYRPIIEGFSSFAIDGKAWKSQSINEEKENECPLGENCCKNKTKDSKEDKVIELFNKTEYMPYDPSQEPIFPPELKVSTKNEMKSLIIRGKRVVWYQPVKLEEALAVKAKLKKRAHVIVGNTKVGIEENEYATNVQPVLIHPINVREMTEIHTTDTALRIGAALTLTELEVVLKAEIKSRPEHETRLFSVLLKILDVFGSQQIRSMCSIGGHIMSSTPVSDLNQIFAAASCLLEVRSRERGIKTILLDHSFFSADERKHNVEDDEIIIALHIPCTRKNQYLESFKHSKRRVMDSAIINMTLNVEFEADTNTIESVSLVFGGVADKIVAAKKTENLLIQRKWNEETLQLALEALMDEFCLSPGSTGGMETYRNALVLSLFFKAYISIGINLKKKRIQNGNILPADYQSAVTLLPEQQHLKSSQYFQLIPASQEEFDVIGKPAVHQSAFKQAAGEAIYCDDIPHIQNELHLGLVCSTEPHARIKHIDASDALEVVGIVAFYSAEDLTPEQNNYGSAGLQDEYIFAPGVVTCIGQIIGVVVGESKAIAQQAAKLVKIEYEILEPVITIQDAIEKKSFHKEPMVLVKGDIENVFSSADHVIKGELRIEGQEHFYMETQVTIAIPKREDCEMEVICSSQNLTEVQRLTANLLGVQRNKIICKIRRLGGGFGGKEFRPSILHLPVAFAAYKLRQPVRCMLDRDEDMEITGGRNPFYGHYEVAFSNEGKLLGCKMTMYINAGHTLDLSEVVLERALTHIQNTYLIPVVNCKGYICKTNLPSNTVFRGAGGPQAMLFAETMIRKVAKFLNKDPLQVSSLNLYKEGDLTYYGQVIKDVNIRKCWDECLRNSDYFTRRTEVDAFNRRNKWKKRGLAVVPTMYGVGYTAVHLNQAGALVLVYLDGSVLLTHGGCEGGQGLHTKMIQVASKVLEIPDKYIHISETSTDKVPNATPSSASVCSDLNGMAVLNACKVIAERIKPFKMADPKGEWVDWVNAAYMARVSLSATGYHKTPYDQYDWKNLTGDLYHYFTNGAACSEVEIDCLTGDHKVLRTDIVMDIGQSLNPAIDVGQIEGAFIQGYGFFVMEQLLYSPKGKLLNKGPNLYKIPTLSDIPKEFNVSILQGTSNPRVIFSSKAVGEPPLFLAASVFYAIKDAICAARSDNGCTSDFQFDSPATGEKIRTSCMDHIMKKIPKTKEDGCTPWNIRLC